MHEKPNILLITTDTQRWDTLRCMGNPYAFSPNLDSLAQEGILFEQAHTSSPVCGPTRSSLLTGLHTPIHGRIENGISRRCDVPVFTDYLKEQGYTNIMVGKTHFNPVPDSFDVQFTTKGEKSSNVDDFYGRHLKKHGYSRSTSHPNPVPEELFMDSFLVDTTIQEIGRVTQKGKRPFFAFCSLLSPHGPVDPPGKWANLYDDIPLPEINYVEGEIENKPLHLRRLIGESMVEEEMGGDYADIGGLTSLETLNDIDLKRIDEGRRRYYGLAAYCDAQVGRLLMYLDETGLRENTLVIFTSDHGQQYFDHGFNNKHNYYDSSWRIPLIMSLPGVLPQGEKRDFAIWNDITATILGAAGTQCDAVQGFDLFTPLKKGGQSPRRCAVGTLYKSAALATKRWKLEYYFEEGEGRLFDRLNDPKEQVDLYKHDDFKDIRCELLQVLLTWRSDICDVNFLKSHTRRGGGPVARRIASHTWSMKGMDAENRLNEAAERINERY